MFKVDSQIVYIQFFTNLRLSELLNIKQRLSYWCFPVTIKHSFLSSSFVQRKLVIINDKHLLSLVFNTIIKENNNVKEFVNLLGIEDCPVKAYLNGNPPICQ